MRFLIRLMFRVIDRLEYGLSTLLWRGCRPYRRMKMRRALRLMDSQLSMMEGFDHVHATDAEEIARRWKR